MTSRLLFKYAALLAGLLLSKDLCLPGATAEEPGFPSTSAVMFIVDPTCDRFDAFTSEYLPTARSEVVWVDGPEFGYFDYDHNSRLMLYIPAPLNRDSIDTFVVYATNEQGDWDIARFFFDPATREMTFAADFNIKPAIQGEKAGLDDSGKPSSPPILGTQDVPLWSVPFEFRIEDMPRPAFPPGSDETPPPRAPRWPSPDKQDMPFLTSPPEFRIEDLSRPAFPRPGRSGPRRPYRDYDLWLDDIAPLPIPPIPDTQDVPSPNGPFKRQYPELPRRISPRFPSTPAPYELYPTPEPPDFKEFFPHPIPAWSSRL